jgi:hypothetical protein
LSEDVVELAALHLHLDDAARHSIVETHPGRFLNL